MKYIIALVFAFSNSVFARQYIQCSERLGDTVMVVNLQDVGKQSTLFLSSGVQNPEDQRVLVNIKFDKVEGKNSIFKVTDENGIGSLSIETESLGKNSNYLTTKLMFSNYTAEFSCFSRIYND